ncbi:hypothetical protein BZG02_01610 [Labilibaculum filiforme]|uniref:STAS/SEC14 domain-containing protein n=1 Tax=Labilibaculum filiforme TaxID=1940526 RepID=A0A2N3I5Z8_9BACT|nr:hypothetical protein [Labilibaculum filiforme]PKQ65729.1 hypothetical protein BZG02_01610 [Labilibaculum filiforme]
MGIEFDNKDFCIRVYANVAYLKVRGMQNEKAALFFADAIDHVLDGYSYKDFASVCDLSELIISSPKVAKIINGAIRKITFQVDYKYNAVVIHPKFGQIIKAYLFSFYLRDTNLKTNIFRDEDKAIRWIEKKGFNVVEMREFLGK